MYKPISPAPLLNGGSTVQVFCIDCFLMIKHTGGDNLKIVVSFTRELLQFLTVLQQNYVYIKYY